MCVCVCVCVSTVWECSICGVNGRQSLNPTRVGRASKWGAPNGSLSTAARRIEYRRHSARYLCAFYQPLPHPIGFLPSSSFFSSSWSAELFRAINDLVVLRLEITHEAKGQGRGQTQPLITPACGSERADRLSSGTAPVARERAGEGDGRIPCTDWRRLFH